MNTRGHLQILCALFLAFCNEFAHGRDEVSGAESLKLDWGRRRYRRGLGLVRNTNIKDAGLTQPQTKPHFECGDGVLAVLLKHADVINTQIYGLQGELLHLPQLEVFCGVSIKPTPTHLHLLFNFDSCYVKKEEAAHILSLRWYGTDFVLPCPVHVPPSVRCKNGAMEMTVVHGTAEVLSVAINEKWIPLLDVAANCWQRPHSHKRRHTFSIPYSSCGIHFRDGRHVLHLKSKDKLIVLSCPYDPVFPVQYPGQLLQQGHPGPRGFNPKALSSEALKQVYAFAAENQETNAARTLSLQPRSYWLPKMPPLPGNFNLSVSFPFSVPLPKHERLREELIFVPDPTPTPTPTPTPSTTSSYEDISDTDENDQFPNYVSEQMDRDRFAWDNLPPYTRYPYKHRRPSQVNSVLANIAQYLPPGYFICSNNDQEPPVFPPTFLPPILNPAIKNQNPGSVRFTPVPVLPLNEYTDRQITRPVASSVYDSSTSFYQPNRRFQSSQYQPYFYQGSYGYRGSSTGSLAPNAPLIPVNLQSQANYPVYPVSQDVRPYQTDGDQSLNSYQGSVFQTHRRRHRPGHLFNFPNSPMNLEVVSADAYTDGADSFPKGFFQPRSITPDQRQGSPPRRGE